MWFGLILLLLVLALLVYLFWRRGQLGRAFQNMLVKHNFRPRRDPPVPAPFVYAELDFLQCFDGDLRPGMPVTLLLGSRQTGSGKQLITYDYVGLYFPPQVQFRKLWLERWKSKVAERGDQWAVHSGVETMDKSWGIMGPPDTLPIRVLRTAEGGTLLAWNSLHQRRNIEARMDEVLKSLGADDGQIKPPPPGTGDQQP